MNSYTQRITELELLVGDLKAQNQDLQSRIKDLEARLKLNSTNSSKPPSSGPIGFKRKPPAPPSGRKRGGQPGHPRAQRRLVPTEKLRSVTECRPTECRRCGHCLAGDDPGPLVHQVAELPRIGPLVDEYRLHRLACPQCGVTTCGRLPEGVPTGCFGPYLQAMLATLAGGYRLSKRQVQQIAHDLYGLSIATGMVSKLEQQSATVLEAPYNEVALAVHDTPAAGIDDTSWRENRAKAQLWVVVTALTTVFTIAAKRSGAAAKALLGTKPNQVVTSDPTVEVSIQYTQGPYYSNSGFGPGGGDSATMPIIQPAVIVRGWQVIPSGRSVPIWTPGNGDVSFCLQVAGRDINIRPTTATGPPLFHYVGSNPNFSYTINGRLMLNINNGQVPVDTPGAARAHGLVPKPFYRVAPGQPIIVTGTYQPTLQPSMNSSPAPMYPKPFFEAKPGDKPFPGSKPSPKTYGPSLDLSYQPQQPPPITYYQPPNVPMTASSAPTDDAGGNPVEAQGESYSLRSNLREFWKDCIFGSLGKKRGN